eukprot:GILK01012054.1.p1 GENE.GILK01012054.1~~GILK01012054.1.p1  ORF type:complete len:614 (+),score=57.31 GILK01012054.1:183-1844(+)
MSTTSAEPDDAPASVAPKITISQKLEQLSPTSRRTTFMKIARIMTGRDGSRSPSPSSRHRARFGEDPVSPSNTPISSDPCTFADSPTARARRTRALVSPTLNLLKAVEAFNELSVHDTKALGTLPDRQLLNLLRCTGTQDLLQLAQVSRRFRDVVAKHSSLWETVDLTFLNESHDSFSIVQFIRVHRAAARTVKLYQGVNSTAITRILQCCPNLEHLIIPYTEVELSKVFLRHQFIRMKRIDVGYNQSPINDGEIHLLAACCPNLSSLNINYSLVTDEGIGDLLLTCLHLNELFIGGCLNLTNTTFQYLATRSRTLQSIEFGGRPLYYQQSFSTKGLRPFQECSFSLQRLRIVYCMHLGDNAVMFLSKQFPDLVEFSIIRDCSEQTVKITDKTVEELSKNCPKIEKLAINFARQMGNHCAIPLAAFRCLRVLDLACSLVQCSLEPLCTGCPFLHELNLSGDSWVTPTSLNGIMHHPTLAILWLGHIDHGDTDCARFDTDYSATGWFVVSLFKKGFLSLTNLHLEPRCRLSQWIVERLIGVRPKLQITSDFDDD